MCQLIELLLAPMVEKPQSQEANAPNESVDGQNDKIDADQRKLMADEIADGPREYTVHCMVHHIGKRSSIRYGVQTYGYTLAGDEVELTEHMTDYFITHYCRHMQKKDTGP